MVKGPRSSSERITDITVIVKTGGSTSTLPILGDDVKKIDSSQVHYFGEMFLGIVFRYGHEKALQVDMNEIAWQKVI